MTNSSHSTQVPMSKESSLYRPLTPRKPVLDGSHQKTSPDAFHHYCSSRCDTVRFLIIVLDLPSNLTRQECLQGGRIELILDTEDSPDRPHDSPLSDHAGFQVHGDLSLDALRMDGWMFTYLAALLQEINNVVAARIVFCPLQVRKQASASANLLFVR